MTDERPVLALHVADEGDRWGVTVEILEGLGEDAVCTVILAAIQTLERAHRAAHALASRRN